MGRRRSAALRDVAGAYHVASRLAREGFRPTVATGKGAGADVLVGLPSASVTVPLMVRTTECPPGFGDGGDAGTCEWRVGKAVGSADGLDLFVVLVDLKGPGELPGVWIAPSDKVSGHLASSDGLGRYRYRASAESLSPYRDDWDAIEDHLTRKAAPRTGWFERSELAEIYGEEFVEALDFEASRLLGVENSTLRRIADGRFPAEDLADAQALLSTLFRRYTDAKREERRRARRDGGTAPGCVT